MNHWSWWISGTALAAVMLSHWFLVGRMMAVSGRFTALVNRLRYGPQRSDPMDPEALIAAVRAASMEEFPETGDSGTKEPLPVSLLASGSAPSLRSPRPLSQHLVFFATLMLGGLASVLWAGPFEATMGIRGETFHTIFNGSPAVSSLFLLLGGGLVGFGTRMSSGCTSGHGLCGTSRIQPGSLVATAAFFGAGIVTSFVLGAF